MTDPIKKIVLYTFAPIAISVLWIWASISDAPAGERASESQRTAENTSRNDWGRSPEPSSERTSQLGRIRESRPSVENEPSILLNDPGIQVSWGLNRMDAPNAWRLEQGRRDVVVAIIDTGIDVNHPDLRENLWVNPGETGFDSQGRDKSKNGLDDDGNGFIDDVHGWNFAESSSDLTDRHGHGTHIAGIIGAVGGNGIGLSGVAPRVSLMILKYYDPKRAGPLSPLETTVRAIKYARKMGAHVINYSAGGLEKSEEEMAAISAANDEGILFVAAAGNEGSNSDLNGFYPADYRLPNILSVTAIDLQNNVLPSSNYGQRTVDIAAPGHEILSTLPNGQYGYLTGTSQATAFATGVAALLLSRRTDLNEPWRLIEYLVKTGDTDPRLSGKTKFRSRLNAYRALVMQDSGVSANGTIASNIAPSVDSTDAFSADADFDRLVEGVRIPQRGPAHEAQH